MPKDTRQPVEGNDAKILIDLFIPGHKPIRGEINIPGIVGQATAANRTPESVYSAIIYGLRSQYGDKVK